MEIKFKKKKYPTPYKDLPSGTTFMVDMPEFQEEVFFKPEKITSEDCSYSLKDSRVYFFKNIMCRVVKTTLVVED